MTITTTRRTFAATFLLSLAACTEQAMTPVAPPAHDAVRSEAASIDDEPRDDRVARVNHVLLISIDGMHQADLTRFVRTHPGSALAALHHHGVSFTNASASKPSDSFPGLLAQITGGSPKSTGVYYDDSYDRELYAPGSACTGHAGTEVVYDESIDRNPDALDGGGGIDPATLPLQKIHGRCAPVYPHQFLRVNTIFEVARGAGLHTAWADKHLAYEIVNGPSGRGVDDLYTPEIASGPYTANVAGAASYDALKVDAVLHEIDGLRHDGTGHPGVPAVFGMNFQAVSVGQKTAGYLDAAGTPTPDLVAALAFVDASLGRMVAEIAQQHLERSTLVIISAKHGQAPIDPATRRIVDARRIPAVVNAIQPGLVGQSTEDDVALVWLTDRARTTTAANALMANASPLGISTVLHGATLTTIFGNSERDSRIPDLIALAQPGVIYSKPTATKRAEHGGFSDEDTHVPLIVSGAGVEGAEIGTPVDTRQIAPTILEALGLRASALDAVRMEGTRQLMFTRALHAGDHSDDGAGQ